MNKIYLFSSLAYILSLLISCDYRNDDHSITLDNKYFISVGNGMGKVLCKKRSESVSDIIIFDEIEDWTVNKTFILLLRHITKESLVRGKGLPDFESQNNGDTIQYWIIKKDIDSVYGPLSKIEYLQKRIAMSIPTDLKLTNAN